MGATTRRLVAAYACGIFVIGAPSSALAEAIEPPRETHADIHLISFGSLRGQIGDCNCHLSVEGSLARRAGYVDSLNVQGVPFLHLDLGDFSSHKNGTGEETTEFIWDIMGEIGVDASTPGPLELRHWTLLRKFIDTGEVPIISSNLTYVAEGEEKHLGHRYLIFEVGEVRVALFALMGAEPFAGAQVPDGVELRLADPLETTRELLPILRNEAEVVVLLSQMTSQETYHLLSEIEGIDVVLHGHFFAPWVEHGSTHRSTIVQQTRGHGLYLGHLVLIVGPEGEIVDWGTRNAGIDESFAKNSEIAKRVSIREAEIRRIRDRVRRERKQSRMREN